MTASSTNYTKISLYHTCHSIWQYYDYNGHKLIKQIIIVNTDYDDLNTMLNHTLLNYTLLNHTLLNYTTPEHNAEYTYSRPLILKNNRWPCETPITCCPAQFEYCKITQTTIKSCSFVFTDVLRYRDRNKSLGGCSENANIQINF